MKRKNEMNLAKENDNLNTVYEMLYKSFLVIGTLNRVYMPVDRKGINILCVFKVQA